MKSRSGTAVRSCSTVGEASPKEGPTRIPFDIPAGNHASEAVIGYEATASGSQNRILRVKAVLRRVCLAATFAVLFPGLLFAKTRARGQSTSPTVTRASLPKLDGSMSGVSTAGISAAENSSSETSPQLIVIGFMGGRVKGSNLIHREAMLAKELQEGYPHRVYAVVFANHDAQSALKVVLHLLDKNRDDRLSVDEKSAARIVIYGHSWGASETVAFARRLNALSIPVLLTIQVDSVQKPNEDDGDIPPNVREAVNFYQTEGLLHGRSLIEAMDPLQTTILGNYKSTYRSSPISCANYPWFARVFMKPHIEIENDPSVWGKIAELIRTKLL
jgi:hypothetical protein